MMTITDIANSLGAGVRERFLARQLTPWKAEWPRLSVAASSPHVPVPEPVDRAARALDEAMRELEELLLPAAEAQEALGGYSPPQPPLDDEAYEKQRRQAALVNGVRLPPRDLKAEHAAYQAALAAHDEAVRPLLAVRERYARALERARDRELELASQVFDARAGWLRDLRALDLRTLPPGEQAVAVATARGFVAGLSDWAYDPEAPRKERLRMLRDKAPRFAPMFAPPSRAVGETWLTSRAA